jgi:hypothetical protein
MPCRSESTGKATTLGTSAAENAYLHAANVLAGPEWKVSVLIAL